MTPSPATPEGGIRFLLDEMTDYWGTEHLKRVARFWADDNTISTKANSFAAFRRVLTTPARMKALVDRLGPTERHLLAQVRQQGGMMDGWGLYTYARLRGLHAPPGKTRSSPRLFGHYQPANFKDADLIWGMLAYGLLFPTGMPNPWLDSHSYYSFSTYKAISNSSPEQSGVIADSRLLKQIPDLAPPPLIYSFAAANTPATPPPAAPNFALSGILTLLRLTELARVLRLQGSLPLVKDGSFSRAALNKLSKALPVLDDPEHWLELAGKLGLLSQQMVAGKAEVGLNPAAFEAMLDGGPHRLMQALAKNGLGAAPEDRKFGLHTPNGLRACLAWLLRELPHATPLSEVLRVLGEVTPKELRESHSSTSSQTWKAWAEATLRGRMTDLGLAQLVGDIVYPNLDDKNPPALASGPAWIVQPNFELMVYPAQLGPAQIRTLGAAEAVALGEQVCTYRLTRDSVYAALEGGQTLDGLLAELEAGSATPLAPSVRRSITDWAARRDRLVLYQGVTVLEFATQEKRNAALEKDGGMAVGETLLILDAGKKPAPGTSLIKYGEAPKKVLKFASDGTFRIDSGLDLMVRGVLAGHLAQEKRGEDTVYRVLPPASGATLASSLLPDLQARATGPLPDLLKTQLAVWTGRAPAPSLAPVTVFQHPQASVLAPLPAFAALLGETLGPGLYAVQAGKEAELTALLSGLGLAPTQQISAPTENPDELLTITDTRKKREYLEQALAAGQSVTIHYHEEKRTGGWYRETITQGKLRQGEYLPISIDRSGNTPYLSAKNLETDATAEIRIAYIVAMRVR